MDIKGHLIWWGKFAAAGLLLLTGINLGYPFGILIFIALICYGVYELLGGSETVKPGRP